MVLVVVTVLVVVVVVSVAVVVGPGTGTHIYISKPEPYSDKLCLGNYNHCIMIIIIIIIIVTHLFSFSVDASTSPCLHKNLMKCTSMRKLVLARTVQHRATRQASIDTDCAAPWKMTHSWRHVARRAACGGLHLSVHKKN